MSIGRNLKNIARYWWIIVLAMLAAGAGTFALDSLRKPQYSGYARVLVRPSSQLTDSRTLVDLLGQVGLRYVTGTFAQTFTAAQVKTAARQSVGLSPEEADRYLLEANVLPDTVVIEVSGHGPDPDVLSKYIDATVQATVQQTRAVFGVVELEPLEPAKVPPAPTSPQPIRDVVLAVSLGLLLGVLLAWSFAFLRETREVQQESAKKQAFWAAQAEWDEKMQSTQVGR
jgi:uncharacterized protein involved in exopolysaccharide biosynthesis